jgi:hypothetical protein
MMQTTIGLMKATAGEFDFAVIDTGEGKNRIQVRGWLNPPGFGSHAHAILEHDDTFGCHTELSIADCQRQITLDFRASTKEEVSVARHKLRQLSALLSMVDIVLEETEQSLLKKATWKDKD